MGPNGLVPSLLVFGVLPAFHAQLAKHPTKVNASSRYASLMEKVVVKHASVEQVMKNFHLHQKFSLHLCTKFEDGENILKIGIQIHCDKIISQTNIGHRWIQC